MLKSENEPTASNLLIAYWHSNRLNHTVAVFMWRLLIMEKQQIKSS